MISSIAALTAGAVFATMAPAHAATHDPAGDAAARAKAAARAAAAAARAAALVDKATGAARIAAPRSAADGSLTAEASGTRVDLPATSAGKMTVTDPAGAQIKIGLPGSNAAKAHASTGGTVVYPQLEGGAVDVAAQVTTEGSASALITLKDASAPTEYRFPLDLPKDAVPIITEDGSLVIADGTTDGEGEIIGAFEAPWAKDDNGKAVATSYRLDGNELVQTIQTDKSTAYPVVADPKWWDKTKKWAKKAGKTAWKYTKKYGVKCAKGAWHGAKNPSAMTAQQKAAFAALGCVFFAAKK
ncbi:hypothetical protein ACFY12_17470 [Streptomyces sp. NPDC001339]|uniref:hypothetical protein n=1 Tax=Streptomyces sp. NPDC001339 TaxID=3364563 RepID=UPI0036C176BA